MNATHDLLEDQIQALIDEYYEDGANYHRILARAVKKIATLDSVVFEKDYLELEKQLNHEQDQSVDYVLAQRALAAIHTTSVLVGKYPRELCFQIGQIAELIDNALFPSGRHLEDLD